MILMHLNKINLWIELSFMNLIAHFEVLFFLQLSSKRITVGLYPSQFHYIHMMFKSSKNILYDLVSELMTPTKVK